MNKTRLTGYWKTVVAFLYNVCFTGAGVVFAESSESTVSDSLPLNPDSMNTVGLFIRFIFALAIVLILLILTLWALKRLSRFRGAGMSDSAIDVLSIRYIERNKAVALVRIVDRVLIIGIAENALSTLGELSSEELDAVTIDATAEPGVFGNVLARFSGKRSDGGQSS